MSMYLEHYGLREAPFRITPHTDYFYAGGNRGATLEALMYAIQHDEGIIRVSGEVGSGKSMLCRMLLERLPDTTVSVFLSNPSLGREDILLAIADDLGMPHDAGHTPRPHELIRNLQAHLVDLFAQNKQAVILIDEAHAMPRESLEEIRLLSNLESKAHKLLQIVLFGQPELDAILSEHQMRQLRERITHSFILEPFQQDDINAYLMFRTRTAGYRGPDLFSPEAIELFLHASQGLTRRLNILADKALLAAYSNGQYRVERPEAVAAINDARFETIDLAAAKPKPVIAPPAATKPASRKPLLVGAAVAGAALSAIAFWGFSASTPDTPHVEKMSTAAAPPAPPPTAPAPATAAPAISAPAPVPPPVHKPARVRAAEFDNWRAGADDRHYVIQLGRGPESSWNEMERIVSLAETTLDNNALRVYALTIDGTKRLGVIYGDYASQEDAKAALAQLPENLRALQPFFRPIRQLRQ